MKTCWRLEEELSTALPIIQFFTAVSAACSMNIVKISNDFDSEKLNFVFRKWHYRHRCWNKFFHSAHSEINVLEISKCFKVIFKILQFFTENSFHKNWYIFFKVIFPTLKILLHFNQNLTFLNFLATKIILNVNAINYFFDFG